MPQSTTQTTTQSTFQSTSELTIETIFQSIDKPILRLCLNDFHLDTSTLLPTSKSTIESTTAVSHSADHSIKRTHRNLSDVPWFTRCWSHKPPVRGASSEAGASLEQKSYYVQRKSNVFFENVILAAVRSTSRETPLKTFLRFRESQNKARQVRGYTGTQPH